MSRIMGFDCTLHVINETLIARRFVARLLEESQEPSPFDARPDAERLWNTVRAALAGKRIDENKEPPDPEETANLVCQLAIAFCAAELPYHYERGFCLSLWPEGQVPRKFIGNPESLFGALVEKHPELKGRFPRGFTGNFSAGIYVPVEDVPELLAWVERRHKKFEMKDRRMFRGLILVLKAAAERKMGYWEAAELPVPVLTIRPPQSECRPDLEEAPAPPGANLRLMGASDSLLVCSMVGERHAFVDVSVWPPRYRIVDNGESINSASCNRNGRWVMAAASTSAGRPYFFNAAVRDGLEGKERILRAPPLRRNGLQWAGWLGERVIGVLSRESVRGPDGFTLPWEHDLPALPVIQKGQELVVIEELPPGFVFKRPLQFPIWTTARLHDGNDVFIWLGRGYELRDGRFEETFALGPKIEFLGESTAPFGPAGFFYICEGRPYSIQRGKKPVSHLLKVSSVRSIIQIGDDAYLLAEGENDMGDIGKLYFQAQDAYIRLKAKLFEEEDPSEIQSLHWLPECGKLISMTSERFWAVPIDTVLALPRHRASTVIKVRF